MLPDNPNKTGPVEVLVGEESPLLFKWSQEDFALLKKMDAPQNPSAAPNRTKSLEFNTLNLYE